MRGHGPDVALQPAAVFLLFIYFGSVGFIVVPRFEHRWAEKRCFAAWLAAGLDGWSLTGGLLRLLCGIRVV